MFSIRSSQISERIQALVSNNILTYQSCPHESVLWWQADNALSYCSVTSASSNTKIHLHPQNMKCLLNRAYTEFPQLKVVCNKFTVRSPACYPLVSHRIYAVEDFATLARTASLMIKRLAGVLTTIGIFHCPRMSGLWFTAINSLLFLPLQKMT